MRLPSRLAYLLSAFVLTHTGLACENETVRITHGGSSGTLIRYRVQINAYVQNGILASGFTDQIQCLNQNDVVTVTVTEVNGQPVSFPASGSPRTASGTPGEVLNFTISGTAPQINWRVDTRTCNQTLFDQSRWTRSSTPPTATC